MPPRASLEAISAKGVLDYTPTEKCGSQLEIPALNALALRSLVFLFNEREGLFSRSVTLGQDGFHHEGVSPKRTIIALLGLHRLEESGETMPFDMSSMRAVVLGDTGWVSTLGDLGLVTWFTAECEPDRLKNLFNQFDFDSALDNYSDARKGHTRALAWFLAGIAHARLSCPRTLPDLTDAAVNTYRLLSLHQDVTAPVGLLALGEATGQSFHESIYKGLLWIRGANELGKDLRSPDRGLIWDSIRLRKRTTNYWEVALSFMNIPRRPQAEALKIRYEARPDHFGWLLYAFGRFGLPKPEIAVQADTAQ